MLLYILVSFFVTCVSIKPINLCVNCKHFINSNPNNLSYGKCKLFPKVDELAEYKQKQDFINYLVTGNQIVYKETPEHYACSTAREFKDMCGENGKLFCSK